jgi:hypothetical protein
MDEKCEQCSEQNSSTAPLTEMSVDYLDLALVDIHR